MRRVRYFLGSFRVVVQIERPLGLDRLYSIREVVSQTFQNAQSEYVPNANVLDSPVHPHVFVSQIRRGSIDFQVIYQGLIDLPWREISETAGHIANQGLVIIERIGGIVAGLEAMRRIGPWVQKRLRGSPEGRNQGEAPEVSIRQESALQADPHALSNTNTGIETAHQLLHDPNPKALIVLLDKQSITVVRKILMVSVEERVYHLGGRTIIHDMNLMLNDVSSLEELREGDPFCLQNPGAIGLHAVHNEDSLFDACAAPNSDLRIDEITMDHIDFPEEHRIVDGPSIDVDDLPS